MLGIGKFVGVSMKDTGGFSWLLVGLLMVRHPGWQGSPQGLGCHQWHHLKLHLPVISVAENKVFISIGQCVRQTWASRGTYSSFVF